MGTMKRIIIISIYILGSFAVTAHGIPHEAKAAKRQIVMEYSSLGNDFAEIKMEIYDNGKFIIRIYPEDGKSLKLKGRWEKAKNFYVLKFRKTPMTVNKLFNLNDPNRLEIINEMGIKFNERLSSLWIWGIQCEKTKGLGAV